MEVKAIGLSFGEMTEKKVNLDTFLVHAREQEKEYCWLDAYNSYRRALEILHESESFRRGQIQEACAYALFRAAMQAENIGEFKDGLSEVERQYKEARQSYSKADPRISSPRVVRCDAMMAYIGFWQTAEIATKKKRTSEAWSLARKAMDAFGQNEFLELAKTYDELFLTAVLSIGSSDDQRIRTTVLTEAIAYGEKLVGLLSETENRDEFVKVSVYLAGLIVAEQWMSVVGIDKKAANLQKAKEYWFRAKGLSEETVLANNPFVQFIADTLGVEGKERLQVSERQLDFVRKTRDRLAIGVTLGYLASLNFWLTGGKDDPSDINAMLDKSLQYVEEAREQFGRIGFITPDHGGNVWVSSPSQPWYFDDKARYETDLRTKRELQLEFLKSARLEFVAAEKYGFPDVLWGAHFLLAHALSGLAKMETNREQKARLLEEAIQHRIEEWRLARTLMPSDYWSGAFHSCAVGQTELELAEVTDRSETKRTYLDSSISHMKEGLDLFELRLTIPLISEVTLDATSFVRMSDAWRQYGRALRRSYELAGARESMITSAAAFERAAEMDRKSGLPSRVAESLWEAAQTYDGVGEHLKASEKFDEASEQYRNASEKVKGLCQFYKDLHMYLKAWSEIEKAKHHHARQEPASSKEHYSKAAELHMSTGKWSFLSTNYSAWAHVESAEDLSQRERGEESIEAFREASRLFTDSKKIMNEQMAKIDTADEKQMVEMMIDASDRREGFCQARVALEEARMLDKQGRLGSASEKYGLVADMFDKIKQGVAAEQDRREIELVVTLSKAWKAMAKAEAESSPGLYEEAAHLFDEAKDLSPGDKAKNLALGHSRLCLALEAGARYADTSDSTLHTAAVQNLESAAKYYLKADLQSAAEYAKASKLLFDSYAYVNRASSEEDQAKKAKLYTMAEKVLQASISSYEKAGQPGRKEQITKILVKVKEDRELAMSLAEVFLAPDIVSTTMAFSSPTPTQETAVGLKRFENADVQATLIVNPKELQMGQELSIEIELVNAGRGAAQLTRMDEVVPEGFQVVTAPEKCRMEDGCLNMRGRRLDTLKTEDVKLVLKPTVRGRFVLKPRITYLDDSGKYKISEPEAVKVTVKEMGISGWIKGT